MIEAAKVFYNGSELLEIPEGKRVSLDVKNLTPRENIYIENVILKYTVSVSADGQGVVTGGGNYDLGGIVTVVATPDAGYLFYGWYINGSKLSDSPTYSFAVNQDVSLVAKFAAPDSIGGRIYYVDSTATGGVYHFYDANGTELTTHTVDGLANAVTYSVESKASIDKFYVYATEDGSSSGNILMSGELEWGGYGTSQGTIADTRGSGKTNSAKCLSTLGGTSGTIWNWLKSLRDSNKNGCNDWFIGSVVELVDLRDGNTSGKSIFSRYHIWSSAELDSISAYHWDYNSSVWYNGGGKNNSYPTIALRSF